MVRQRHPPSKSKPIHSQSQASQISPIKGVQENMTAALGDEDRRMSWRERNQQWIGLALASGACAAFNGVFAKL
jgi:hypothetical protein